jgi:hypothetical protein
MNYFNKNFIKIPYYFFLLSYTLLLCTKAFAQPALGDSTWLMFHHDNYHTGLSPLTGNMDICFLDWSYTTDYDVESSPALGDIDGDGNLEVVFGFDDNNVYALNGEVGIEEAATLLPITFDVVHNHPNPFTKITEIKYALPKDSRVNITVYNLSGQKIATLVHSQNKAGYHTVQWDTKNYSSGIYFIRFEAGNYTETKKIVLIR